MAYWHNNDRFIFGATVALALIASAGANANFQKCCIQAARAKYSLFTPTLPWNVCGNNATGAGLGAPINPSVNATLAWCEQNCPGHQPSTISEWLHPISTWIIPYVGLLFVCPIGERGEAAVELSIEWVLPWFLIWFRWLPDAWTDWLQRSDIQSWISPMLTWISNLIFSLSQYAGIIGDPASAIWGSFSELAEDWWLSDILLHMTDLRRELVTLVILTGQSELDERTEEKLTKTLLTRFVLDIVGHEHSEGKLGGTDEKSPTPGSEIITPIEENPSKLATLSSKEIDTTTAREDVPSSLKARELRRRLKLSFDYEAQDPWQDVDTSTVAKAVVAITHDDKIPPDLSLDSSNHPFSDALNKILMDYAAIDSTERRQSLLAPGTFTHRLWNGIRVLLKARVDFVNTILIPVILMLVVTASVFYDAYQALGDNDTAHSLAYGLLYSWLIILAVASNCYTSSLTAGLVEQTIGESAEVLPISDVTVGLRFRYTNALRWRRWLGRVGVVEEHRVHGGRVAILLKYTLGQLFGWICVAIVASCGAAISYTTPTVGIGCRSFTMLLYALGSLIVCLIPVLQYWNELRPIKGDPQSIQIRRAKLNIYITWFYRIMAFTNGGVLLIGTLLHLTGNFRSCWCMNIFARDDKVLELNTQTAQAVHNATVYWLPVGYVAFVFIWCVSAAAIIMRQVINFRVEVMQGLKLGEEIGDGHED